MGDCFYRVVRTIGGLNLFMTARPVVIGADHVPAAGPFILACTHQSPYDVPLLIRHTPRLIDFVSITEVFRIPLVGWFYGRMNAFPLERSRPDPATVRIILDRLKRGRAVAMFPEGRLRTGRDSVIHTRRIQKGLGRIAAVSGAPVVPCVILNSSAYARFRSWLPFRRTRYGVIYGRPLIPESNADHFEDRYISEIVRLHAVLSDRLDARH